MENGKWEIVNDEWDLEDSGWAHRCSTLNVNESILKTNSVFSGRIKYTHRPLTVAFQCLLILVFKTSPINTWKLFFFSSSIILDQLILLTPLSSKSHSAFTISHFSFPIFNFSFPIPRLSYIRFLVWIDGVVRALHSYLSYLHNIKVEHRSEAISGTSCNWNIWVFLILKTFKLNVFNIKTVL